MLLLCLANPLAQAKAPAQKLCAAAQYRIFDRLLGGWKIYQLANDTRTLLSSLKTQSIAQGCAVKQIFSANSQGMCKVIYAAGDGEASRFRWEQNEEELIRRKIANPSPDKKRLVTFDISADQYFVLDKRSHDWGKTWQQHSVQLALRVPPPPNNHSANSTIQPATTIAPTTQELSDA